MPRVQRKNLSHPDQVRSFPNGRIDLVSLDEMTIGRFTFQPGWRWSKDVGPIMGTRSCQLRHAGYVISGALRIFMDDGTEMVASAGDAYEIPPGHDACVDGAEAWDAIEFTSGYFYAASPEEHGERVLATILFCDVVDSTATLGRVGDNAWANLLREHKLRVRAVIDRFRGREIDASGDGFLVLFDGAARAVRAAAAMDPAVSELGIRLRAGLHTSEVQILDGQIRGVAVHTAARVMGLAGAGEVFVSSTTRELLEGSGLALESRGDFELKGIAGHRTIFALQR
jgi:class 3 adenylate cyclase